MGDETFIFPMNSRHHKTESGYIVLYACVCVFNADMADLVQFATYAKLYSYTNVSYKMLMN